MPVYTIEYVFLGNMLLGYLAVTFSAYTLNQKLSLGIKLMFAMFGALVAVFYLWWPLVIIKLLALFFFIFCPRFFPLSLSQTLKFSLVNLTAYFLLNGLYQALIFQGYHPLVLIFLGLLLLVLGKVIYLHYQNIRRLKQFGYTLEIGLAGNTAVVTSYLDTGNRLKDPYLGWPVLVVEYRAVEKILPKDFLKSGQARKIPFRSVEKQGYLWGFIPDFLKISQEGKTIIVRKVVVAVTFYRLAEDFQALLSEELIKSA